jgi:2-C-methyl-D-erythritol 4-phosphate cytidylyltransferase/2-C-methyl-D-erythritol 2,4-cyclodiphosphate synthase
VIDEALAVVVAAGRSRRMGTDKLWIDLYGRPTWRWSVDTLLGATAIVRLALVVPSGAQQRFADLLPAAARDRCLLVAGGETRADSVQAGLAALAAAGAGDGAIVLVHDAARPALSAALVDALLAAAGESAGVVPALPISETLLRGEGNVDATRVERAGLLGAQTPQLGRLGDLRRAVSPAFTDDASALAAAGVTVRIVPGEAANRKLTAPGDEALLRAVLRARSTPVTTPSGSGQAGIGFDAHRLEAGRPLRLAGITFEGEPRGLAGHSDGDAALHALIDALLGAVGDGDIGSAFPATERWRGADSAELLRLTAQRLRDAGWRPVAVDLTIVAARPAIAPRRDEMRRRVGELLDLPVEAVSVKGTTSDGLGFAGDEGIAAYAVANVSRTT